MSSVPFRESGDFLWAEGGGVHADVVDQAGKEAAGIEGATGAKI